MTRRGMNVPVRGEGDENNFTPIFPLVYYNKTIYYGVIDYSVICIHIVHHIYH